MLGLSTMAWYTGLHAMRFRSWQREAERSPEPGAWCPAIQNEPTFPLTAGPSQASVFIRDCLLVCKGEGKATTVPQKGRAWYRGSAHYAVDAVIPESAQPAGGDRAKVGGTESEDRFEFKS